ncbi:MAG TPA: methyltransferase domain-containing protein [Pirellulales bacterium]|nr:methyltransferase domain-containing protein [Pirellulales bacterium]
MNVRSAPLDERFDIAAAEITIAGRRYELLKPRDADELLDEEEFEHDDRIPYWAELWPSARVLAERLAERPGNGRRLIELGCGVGLVSLVAQAAGYRVLATDYYDDALEFVRANAARNGVEGLATRMVDWRHMPDDLGRFDLVVATDVLYEKLYAALVPRVIAGLLAPDGMAVVTDPRRGAAAQFPVQCETQDLRIVSKEVIEKTVDDKTTLVDLFTLQPSLA